MSERSESTERGKIFKLHRRILGETFLQVGTEPLRSVRIAREGQRKSRRIFHIAALCKLKRQMSVFDSRGPRSRNAHRRPPGRRGMAMPGNGEPTNAASKAVSVIEGSCPFGKAAQKAWLVVTGAIYSGGWSFPLTWGTKSFSELLINFIRGEHCRVEGTPP
jgi:hypothetical protein